MSTVQPKTVQKMLLRFAIGLLSIAGLLLAYNYLKGAGRDLNNLGSTDTAGYIALLKETDRGVQLVVLKPDGSEVASPGYVEGTTDRELAWRPDGNQIVFVSDRKDQTFNLFRWNLANGSCEPRTTGTQNYGNPMYPSPSAPEANEFSLVTSGGFVYEFDPVKPGIAKVLPPSLREIGAGEEGEGAAGQFDTIYKKIGNSFRVAKWTADKKRIVAVMRRDTGEVLIVQKMVSDDGKPTLPQIIAAGENIQFDVSPTDNKIVYSLQNFDFPDPERIPREYIKNGKATIPFKHATGILNLDDPADAEHNGIIVASKTDDQSGANPRFAPDGASFLLTVGTYTDGGLSPKALVNIPARMGGLQATSPLREGEIYDAGWSPDGKSVLFVQVRAGKRTVYKIGVDGGGETKVVEGNYSRPAFSPQVPK
jgi:hypothetical protein